MERNIHKVLSEMEDISNLHTRDSSTPVDDITHHPFGFDFSNMKYFGSQVQSPLFTLNRLKLIFRYSLKKETTKVNILEAVNNYNSDIPLIKISLKKHSGKSIETEFSIDFLMDDSAITEEQLIPIINILAPCPSDFVKFLGEKKIYLTE